MTLGVGQHDGEGAVVTPATPWTVEHKSPVVVHSDGEGAVATPHALATPASIHPLFELDGVLVGAEEEFGGTSGGDACDGELCLGGFD